MDRIKWTTTEKYITLDDVNSIEFNLTKEQHNYIQENVHYILHSLMGFKDIKDRILAEKMLRIGFIAGSVDHNKET